MSVDREKLMDVLERAHKGPVCKENEWNIKVIPQTMAEQARKYGLQNTCDPSNLINQDDDLADRFFQAGLDAAVETGMLCTDTHRVIKFSREEILSAVEQAPEEFWLGEGDQRVYFKHRQIEDPSPPVWIAPLSIAVTEDIFVPMVEGIARVLEVDCMEGPSLETLWGRRIRSGSPYELLAGRYQADLMEEGIQRAGREGMGLYAVGSSPTEYGFLGGYGVPNGYRPDRDIALILSPADIRTSYESLFKLAQAFNCGAEHVYAGSWVMIGGYAGGPEGATIGCIAYTLLLYAIYQASHGGCFPFDLHYMGNCDRKAQWSLGMVFQALSRNTHLVLNSVLNQVAGPCTKMLLYESAVGMMNLAVSGASSSTGTRSAGGRLTNYLSPLEIKFAGEVFKAAAGMSRAQANEIADKLLPKYEDMLRNPPDGKSFKECYDIEKLEPTEEWQRMYNEVKEELMQMGLPMA